MKKIRLDLDHLQVDTFETERAPRARGTVEGRDFTDVRDGCVYPTPSCGDTETYGAFTCFCLYARTDPDRICCNSDIWCSNGCGGGSAGCGTATCGCESAPDPC